MYRTHEMAYHPLKLSVTEDGLTAEAGRILLCNGLIIHFHFIDEKKIISSYRIVCISYF